MLIHSRPVVIYQLIGFCLMSPYYIHLASSLSDGTSAISSTSLFSFFIERPVVCVLAFVATLLVWRMTNIAKWFVSILVLFSLANSMHTALIDFNKIILLMSFLYIVTAYYLVMVYRVETSSASYNPLYSQSTIGKRSEYNLPCSLKISDESFAGLLTNWDERGCFVSFDAGEAGLVELRGELRLEVRLDNVTFSQIGKVVGSYERGVGIRFTPKTDNNCDGYNWSEYYKIIDDRGFLPRSRYV